MTLAEKINYILQKRRITQKELARDISTTQTNISLIKHGFIPISPRLNYVIDRIEAEFDKEILREDAERLLENAMETDNLSLIERAEGILSGLRR